MKNFSDDFVKLCEKILDNFGLSQQVTDSTHDKGHMLDLIISKVLHISEVLVTGGSLSDHPCVC